MAKFSVDFTYKAPGWGNVEIDADDAEQAEFFAKDYVLDTFDGASDIEFAKIKEV